MTPTGAPAALATTVVATAAAATSGTALSAVPTPTVTITPSRREHIVRPGDTLLGLARQYGVSMAAIQLANGLGESTALRAGQMLNIPGGPTWPGESPFWVVHTIRSGETLVNIAQSFGVTVSDLARINGLADPALIRTGQAIVIPLDSIAVATAKSTPTRTPTARPTARVSPLTTPQRPASPLATPSPQLSTPTATTVPVTVPGDMASWPNTVVALINQKRAAHGLPPYAVAPELMRAAQAHADDCSAHDWCGHTGSDGSDTRTRLIRAGYTPKVWGENWVQARDPISAVNWWYNETPPNDPHRKNLLHTLYTELGIGIARADNGYYFIANFGSR